MKINTICFILLFFLLISAVNATDSSNETLKTINQQDSTQEIDTSNMEKLQMNTESPDVICKSNENENVVGFSNSKNVVSAVINKEKIGAKYVDKLEKATPSNVNMKAPDVKMYFKDGSDFKVTLKDKNKKAIKNAKIKITIDGTTYTKKTDSKGVAKLGLNLKSGTYKVVSVYEGSSYYKKKTLNSKVTIKSTIKCSDLTKYYKNPSAYSTTFYDKKGKVLKNTAIKFKLNGKTYSVKTTNKGIAKLAIDLKPGKYSISSINSKTSETITKTITIKTLIETRDLTMNDGDGSRFNVKILDCNGKVSPNKKVTVKVNGQTFTPTTDKNGIASIPIEYDVGKYTITTEYDGLKNTNQLTINKAVKKTTFSHITLIPNYVNVTIPYAFHNSAYTLKTGFDGIVKMPKNEVFTIQISPTKGYIFTAEEINGLNSIAIGYKTHLIPFDGSDVKSDFNKANLKGDGVLISKNDEYTQIEVRSTTYENIEFFAVHMDKGTTDCETIAYLQNDNVKAQINFFTYSYDDLGVKYSLAKYYGKSIYMNELSYDELTNHNSDKIKFTLTNKTVNLDYVGSEISENLPCENLITKFIVNGVEELEKEETISYGLRDNYQSHYGFEAVQSYAILNEKITKNIVEEWTAKGNAYLMKIKTMHLYGMFLAALETAWLADEMADQYAKEYNVVWKRGKTATILGGINLDDTYVHVLNADMGMKVSGNSINIELFKFKNSLNLPNIEEYVLEPVAEEYDNVSSNSLDNVFSSIAENNFSISQLGEMIYVFDGEDSAIALNTTSGVSNVLVSSGNGVYKGSNLKTKTDCCSICNVANDIYNALKNTLNKFKSGASEIINVMNKAHPLSMLAYQGLKYVLSKTLTGVSSVALGLFTTMAMIQSAGVTYRTDIVEEKDWHGIMDTYTFTRAGYLQGKKVYNIPNKNGGYDYVEVPINTDLTLDRNNAKYISSGQTKKLSKEETYQYFTEDYWSPFSLPTKYWDKSWKNS